MKRLLLTAIIAILFITNTNAQTVNDVPLADVDVQYIQIVGTSKLLSSKITIQIDFGQETTFWTKGKDTQLYNKDGKRMVFESMIDALNFLSDNGYHLKDAYALTMGNVNVYHFLLEKNE